MRKLFLGLLIGAVVAYGGLKLYVANSISETADQVVALAAPVARISYEGTTSSLDGTVGLTGINIEVFETGDTYQIDAIKLKTDSIFTLLDMESRLREGDIPKTFGFAVENMTVSANTQLLEQAHGDLGLWGGLQLPYGSLACGDREGFSAEDLHNMGLARTTTSLSLDVRRVPVEGEIHFQLHVNSPGLNTQEVEMVMSVPGGMVDPRAAMSSPPQIESASATLQDQGWHKKVSDFCAAEAGMDKQAYVDAHVAAVKNALASDGIEVGDSLTGAYREFLQDGSSITLAFWPSGTVDLATLHYYSLQDALLYLGMQLSVNGEPVTPLDIAETEPAAAREPKAKAPAKTATKNENLNFKAISIPELKQHVGAQVRLTTTRARTFQGKLADIQDRIAHVEVHYGENVRKEIVLLPEVKKAEVEVTPAQGGASE